MNFTGDNIDEDLNREGGKPVRRRSVTVVILLAAVLLGILVRMPAVSLSAVPAEERDLFRDGEGEPYLTEQDSYYYLRMARTMAEENRLFLFNRRADDPMMGMRFGADLTAQGDPALLSVILVCLWRVLSLFFPVTLIQAARWTAPALAALAAVPAFLYVKKRAGLAGAATAGILAGAAIPFAAHSFAGFFDTDCLLAVVPLGMVTSQLRATQEERAGKQTIYAALAGGCFGILSLLWSAYYAYFWLIAIGGGTGALLILLVPFRCRAARRMKALRGFGLVIGFSLLFLLLCRGTSGLAALGSVLTEYGAVTGADPGFPYVHRYTVEMQPLAALPDPGKGLQAFLTGGTDSLLNRMGGLIPCLLAAASLPLALVSAAGKRRNTAPESLGESIIPVLAEAGMLLPWLAAGLKLSLDWRRCAEIAVLPLALMAGLGTGFMDELFFSEEQEGRSQAFGRIAAAALAVAVCAATVSASLQITANSQPDITDPKAEALASIRETEPEDAVIASWWDDGYFMQYTARRRTLADGGSSSAKVYWFLGKALLSEDPAQMTGIFRMLAAAGVSGLEELKSRGIPEAQAADLLARAAALGREQAAELLAAETGIAGDEIRTLTERLFPEEQKPMLLALGSDLLKKIQAVCYFGSWNPVTGKQELVPSWAASMTSVPAEPGTVCELEMNTGAKLKVRFTEDGTAELAGDPDSAYSPGCPISLWEDGICLQDTEGEEGRRAVILIRDRGRLCAFTCDGKLRGTILVRLLVCGGKEIPGIEAAGTWYGADRGDPCREQSMLRTDSTASRGIRIWRLNN